MMDDLIKRSDAVRVVEDWYQYGSGRAMLIDSINALPAAAPATPEVPATRVRCWNSGTGSIAVVRKEKRNDDGIESNAEWFDPRSKCFTPCSYEWRVFENDGDEEITPARAIELLADWPEGREKFIAYCREHPAIDPPPPPAEPAAEGVTVTRELAGKIERLSKALIDMNITLCKYVADDDNLTPLQCEALRAAYMDEQVNASMVFHDLAEARQKAGG